MKIHNRAILLILISALALAAGACRTLTPAPPPEAPAPTAPAPAASDEADAGVANAEPEAEKAYDNTIRWTTATELDNFGFEVYRSESPDGPFERINPETIEGAGTVDEPRTYRYVDDTIDPRKTYYYYVESISMSGVRERFTPIGKAAPKIPAEDEAPDGEG